MISYPSWNLHVDNVEDWAFFADAFTTEQCDALVEYCKQQDLQKGKVGNKKETSITTRDSKIAFIPPTEFMAPYYERISAIVLSLNEQFFKFDLHGFGENLQFTEYEAPTGKYESHVDRAYRIPIRKLSIIIQLTDPETYEGGDLELLSSIEHPICLPKSRGTLIAFPSFQLHRVTPVTKGTRNSLVGWINGKQFR
jgi:PKHD-type hydroxylase